MKPSILSLFFFLALQSCAQETALPAANASIEDLQTLAKNYETAAASFSASPQQLNTKGRQHFVRKVFEASGFDYWASVRRLATPSQKPMSKHENDLTELLLFPVNNLTDETIYEIHKKEQAQMLIELRRRQKNRSSSTEQ